MQIPYSQYQGTSEHHQGTANTDQGIFCSLSVSDGVDAPDGIDVPR
jgi:hypothetical protein